MLKHLPGCEVRAFGSRVTGAAKDYSDLDLAVLSPEPVPTTTWIQLKEDFSESNLPYRVDILEWNALPESFKQVILKNYELF